MPVKGLVQKRDQIGVHINMGVVSDAGKFDNHFRCFRAFTSTLGQHMEEVLWVCTLVVYEAWLH